jgi:hypothetical protein
MTQTLKNALAPAVRSAYQFVQGDVLQETEFGLVCAGRVSGVFDKGSDTPREIVPSYTFTTDVLVVTAIQAPITPRNGGNKYGLITLQHAADCGTLEHQMRAFVPNQRLMIVAPAPDPQTGEICGPMLKIGDKVALTGFYNQKGKQPDGRPDRATDGYTVWGIFKQ